VQHKVGNYEFLGARPRHGMLCQTVLFGSMLAVVVGSLDLGAAELTNVSMNVGCFLTGFNAAGTGYLAGTGFFIPEPTAVVTMTAALVGLVVATNERRRRERPRACVHR
jgi:hypothetical protein